MVEKNIENSTDSRDIPLVALHHVSKMYRSGREKVGALQDITMSVDAGELLAVVGPSGSGKTTLTHVIGGLIRPTSGEVAWRGKALNYASDKAMSTYRNKSVGFVFQNYNLLPHYTALENVMMPLIVAGVAPRKRTEIATRYLKLMGLEKQINRRGDQLSGGQRQRVGIARALSIEPEMIIADEPTGNLDTAHGDEIMSILQTLCRTKHIAVILITHNDALARRADRMVRIVDGKLIDSKTPGATHAR